MSKFFLIFVLSTVLTSLGVSQETPQVFRDWSYERKDLGAPFGDVCAAFTEKKVGEDTWRLSILYTPNQDNPTHVVITSQVASLDAKILYSQTDSSKNIQKHYRSEFLDSSFGAKAFWFAPVSFVDFYKYIRRGSSLKVKYVQENEVQLNFSLMGSTAATNKIAELCNNKKEFIASAFYDYVDKVDVAQNPITTDASIESAWQNLTEAWHFYGVAVEHQAQIANLQRRIDPLLAQQREYLKQQGLLTKEIESSEEAKEDLELQLATQKQQIGTLNQELVLEDSKLQTALSVLKEKEDAFRPIKEEGRSYFAAVESAKAKVNSMTQQIAQSEEQLRQTRIKLSNLWDEASLLDSRIQSQQFQLSQLRSDRIRANNEYLSYNLEREYQQKLATDSIYQMRLRSKNQSDNDLIHKRNVLSREESTLRNLQQQLQNCRSQPNRDCSSLQNQVARQRSEVSRAERDYSNEQSTNRTLASQLESRRIQLRQVVENELATLASRVNSLDVSIRDVERALTLNQSRLNLVRTIEIPRTDRELSSLENTLVLQQGQLSSARESLRWAEQDLLSFKLRTDYDRKEQEYFLASSNVQSIQASLAKIEVKVQNLKAAIAKNEVKINTLSAHIEKLITDLASTQSELQDLQATLTPLLQERQNYALELERSQAALKENAQVYRVVLRDLPVDKNRLPQFPEMFQDWLN